MVVGLFGGDEWMATGVRSRFTVSHRRRCALCVDSALCEPQALFCFFIGEKKGSRRKLSKKNEKTRKKKKKARDDGLFVLFYLLPLRANPTISWFERLLVGAGVVAIRDVESERDRDTREVGGGLSRGLSSVCVDREGRSDEAAVRKQSACGQGRPSAERTRVASIYSSCCTKFSEGATGY